MSHKQDKSFMRIFKTKSVGREKLEHAENERRSFLRTLGVGSLLVGLAGLTAQSLRSLIPNVTYEPLRRMKVGHPTNFAEGMTFLSDIRLYVFRAGRTYYAVSGACTHLGCTVKYVALQSPKLVEIHGEKKTVPFEFHCPCHGSKFYSDGTQYDGPAPAPLHWYRLELSPDDGQLLVDLNQEVEQNFRLTV
jgi:nitrite reductase/ring-hydroxylating ferredoxin subunit